MVEATFEPAVISGCAAPKDILDHAVVVGPGAFVFGCTLDVTRGSIVIEAGARVEPFVTIQGLVRP